MSYNFFVNIRYDSQKYGPTASRTVIKMIIHWSDISSFFKCTDTLLLDYK